MKTLFLGNVISEYNDILREIDRFAIVDSRKEREIMVEKTRQYLLEKREQPWLYPKDEWEKLKKRVPRLFNDQGQIKSVDDAISAQLLKGTHDREIYELIVALAKSLENNQ